MNPEVEEPITAFFLQYCCISDTTACLISKRSGTLSWIHNASSTASFSVEQKYKLPSSGSVKSYNIGRARLAFNRTSSTFRSTCGSLSNTLTSHPLIKNRASQPAPITPPPIIAATFFINYTLLRKALRTIKLLV